MGRPCLLHIDDKLDFQPLSLDSPHEAAGQRQDPLGSPIFLDQNHPPVYNPLHAGSLDHFHTMLNTKDRTGTRICPYALHFMGSLTVAWLLAGCVTVQVEPLSQDRYPALPADRIVEVLQAEPARPHVRLARVTATSEYVDEDALRDKIVAYARRFGADAVVLGKSDVIESMGQGQSYQSTLPPDMQSSIFGGMGSGMPFFFDPWTYTQASTDRVEWTLYLSGVAIRYMPDHGPGQS